MEDVATCLFLYDVKSVTPDAQKLAEICVACTLKVQDAVAQLESMKNADAIMRICGEIDRLGGKIREAGHTLAVTKPHFKDGRVKAEVALAKGKKAHDKRATVREREAKKEVARAMKHYKR